MLRYLFALLLLSTGSIFFSLKGKKFEESLPITIGFIIVFLYIFYIFDFLLVGYYLLVGIMLALYAIFIYKFIKLDDKKNIINNIFTPGFLVFFIVLLGIFFIVRNRTVLLWDELRLWGAYPKILFYNNHIQLGENAQLWGKMQCYEPGMPLFQYFFSKSTFRFLERDLFISYSILGLSTLIPLCKNIDWKRWYLIPVTSILLIGIPYAINNNGFDSLVYYYTLFIEPILGFYFAYTIFLSFKNDTSKFFYLTFALGVFTLVLLKDTGIMFALASAISFTINQKHLLKDSMKNKKRIIYFICLFICILSIFASWKLIQKVYSTENMYTDVISKEKVISFINDISDAQEKTINIFVDSTKNKAIYKSNIEFLTPYINTITVSTFFILFFIALIYLNKKNDRFRYKTSFISFLIASAMFIIGYLILCIFVLKSVLSYSRYLSTVFSACYILTFMILFDKYLNDDKRFNILCIIFIFFSILVLPISNKKIKVDFFEKNRESIIDYSNKIADNVNPQNDKLVLVFCSKYKDNSNYVIYHHNIYYELLDEGFDYIPVLFTNDPNFKDNLEKYDYAYIIMIKSEDQLEINNVFDLNIDNSDLIKIEDNSVYGIIEQ